MAPSGNTLTINTLTLNSSQPTNNKWGIYFPSNTTIPYFEAQLALPSGDNTSYIGTSGTLTLFIRPSITNYYQLEAINANLVGQTVTFSGPSFSGDPRYPGVVIYNKIPDSNGITTEPTVNTVTPTDTTNSTDPFLYFDYSTNKIVGPTYTNLIELQNTQTDGSGTYLPGTTTPNVPWFIFNGVDIPKVTSSFTDATTFNSSYNKFLLQNSPTLTYYATRSLPYDIAILDSTKFNITKVDNTMTLKYNGSYTLNYTGQGQTPTPVSLSNYTYSLASVQNYFFFTFETGFTLDATPQQKGKFPSAGASGNGLGSVVYYIKSSDLISQITTLNKNSSSFTQSITLKLQGTRFLLADSTITISASITASYATNVFVPVINTVTLTPNYTYTPSSSYGLKYKYVLPPSGLLPGSADVPTIYQNVAQFTCSGQKDIFITNFNTLYTNTNNYTGTVALPLDYPSTFALAQDTGKDFPYLFSTWDTVTLTEAPVIDKFGVVIYNYPYGSQYLPLDNTNKNVVYKWKIIQDPDTYDKAKIVLTRPDDSNVYNIVLTPTNTSLSGSYYDSYGNQVTNWASVKDGKRQHNYIKGLYIDITTSYMTYDIDTDVMQNNLQFVIVNSTDSELYITSSNIDWQIEGGYTYTGSYGYHQGQGYTYDNYYLLYDIVSGLGPIAPQTQGRFVLEAVEPNMWSLATITLDTIGDVAPVNNVVPPS